MRLLNVQTRQLEEFFHLRDPPPYAILSHTWDRTEVTLQDIKNNIAQNHPAYSKINDTCMQAIKDGYQYVWIDTCCIDKSSSAELSEAINSMFQWYHRSEVCYAFLPDVAAIGDQLLDLVKDGHLENDEYDTLYSSQFIRSRWFTRGWTLQELLAPRRIDFFGSGWTYLGTRDSLSRCISVITRIPERALGIQSTSILNSFSIAERMSWSATRETTRVEDTAYCLLGIFGINMPLLYGEAAKAFARLQEEIIKVSSDHTIFAWNRPNFSNRPPFGSHFLAPSPESFYSERKLVQCPWFQFIEEAYSISNIGLSIKLPFSTTSQGRPFCVLGCNYEDEPEGPIGIFLKAWDHDQNFWLFGPSFVINRQQAEQAKSDGKRLILSHSEPIIGFTESEMRLAMNRFIVDTKIDIEHVYPEQYWNRSTKVVCFPENAARIGAFSLSLSCGYFVVLFGAGERPTAKKTVLRCHSPWVFIYYVPRIRSFKVVVQRKLNKLSKEASTLKQPNYSAIWKREMLRSSISTGAAFGWVFILKVRIKRTQLARLEPPHKCVTRRVLEARRGFILRRREWLSQRWYTEASTTKMAR